LKLEENEELKVLFCWNAMVEWFQNEEEKEKIFALLFDLKMKTAQDVTLIS
jgi:hypothetical protein